MREGDLAVDDDLGVLLGVDVVGEDLLEGLDEVLEVVSVQLGVELDALLGLLGGDGVLEELAGDAHDDVGEHLDEAAVGVVGEARVLGLLDEALDGVVVQAEVEDGVHHAGHGERGAGAHGDEQRVLGVAELLAHALLEVLAVLVDLVEDALRPHVAGAGVGDAGLARDGEAGRDGQADVGHLGEVGALAARDPLGLGDGLARDLGHVVAVGVEAKAVYVLFCHFSPLLSYVRTPHGAHLRHRGRARSTLCHILARNVQSARYLWGPVRGRRRAAQNARGARNRERPATACVPTATRTRPGCRRRRRSRGSAPRP